MTDHLKNNWDKRQNKLDKLFEDYKEKTAEYLEAMTVKDPSSADVARMMKELQILWQHVEHSIAPDAVLDKDKKDFKERIEDWIAANKKIYGLTEDDIERAELFTTSTGRQTATPQFTRRFDA